LTGDSGQSVELRATDTHIQWRVVGGEWADLIALAALVGPASIEPGPPGLSAYQVAVAAGFEGSEAEWLASLQSTEPGPPGVSNWEAIEGRPETFPPAEHDHDIEDVTGLAEALQTLAEAEALPAGGTPGQILTRTADGAEWADLVIVVGIDGGNAFTTH
jgi:hypothetical protein